MAAYVQLDGVRTWYEEHGDGEALVLRHPGGAGVDARARGPNLGAVAARFHVYTPEWRGHGHTPDIEGPITLGRHLLSGIGGTIVIALRGGSA